MAGPYIDRPKTKKELKKYSAKERLVLDTERVRAEEASRWMSQITRLEYTNSALAAALVSMSRNYREMAEVPTSLERNATHHISDGMSDLVSFSNYALKAVAMGRRSLKYQYGLGFDEDLRTRVIMMGTGYGTRPSIIHYLAAAHGINITVAGFDRNVNGLTAQHLSTGLYRDGYTECTYLLGDPREYRLWSQFDVVLVPNCVFSGTWASSLMSAILPQLADGTIIAGPLVSRVSYEEAGYRLVPFGSTGLYGGYPQLVWIKNPSPELLAVLNPFYERISEPDCLDFKG